MARTLLCLVRHGETNWNIERRFQGQFDIALNARGRAQAEALAEELATVEFDYVYSSDLRRARSTAEAVVRSRGLKIFALAELREKNDGVWQGHTHAEVQALYPDLYPDYLARNADFCAPEGESLKDFQRRITCALTKIAQEHEGCSILIVAHAGVLDIAWRLATGKSLEEKRINPVLNATPNWVAYEKNVWSLVDWAGSEGRAEISAPWDGQILPRREAARGLIVSPEGRVLLIRYAGGLSPHFIALGHQHFWSTPGGALKENENYAAALSREIFEETGLRINADVGPVVATREFPMELGDDWRQAIERYYLIHTPEFTPTPIEQTQEEKAHMLETRWWSIDELAQSQELIFPEGLEELLRKVMTR
ncbi:MAG: NUDIX domain-containing protein [Methylocystaceae bacterium]|jgi:probable phosphoglycerate mutase|nr:NUDIX domain-containing protein [Methylocystaceae bacterium]